MSQRPGIDRGDDRDDPDGDGVGYGGDEAGKQTTSTMMTRAGRWELDEVRRGEEGGCGGGGDDCGNGVADLGDRGGGDGGGDSDDDDCYINYTEDHIAEFRKAVQMPRWGIS